MTLLVVVIILVLLFGGGGWGYSRGYYGGTPFGIVGFLALLLVLYLVFGGALARY